MKNMIIFQIDVLEFMPVKNLILYFFVVALHLTFISIRNATKIHRKDLYPVMNRFLQKIKNNSFNKLDQYLM